MPKAFETLLVTHADGVMHVTLNRPDVRNAMSMVMVEDLLRAEQDAVAQGARMIVLRGAGGHFCSGGDIKDMNFTPAGPDEDDPIANVNARFGELCLAYSRSRLPIIAVVEGAVMGGGFGLSCVADVVIAHDSVVFRLPETGLGIIPAQIAPFLVERLGYSQAKRLAVTGGKLDSEAALKVGLVHQVCADEDGLQAALNAQIAQIRKGAPNAIAETKALIARAQFEPAAALYKEAAEIFAKASRSEEGSEGMTAFIEKRPAKWV